MQVRICSKAAVKPAWGSSRFYRANSVSDNPMITLNHAVAAAMVHGPRKGLELLSPLDPHSSGPMGNNVVITVITGHFLTQAMCQRTIYSPTIERIFAIIALVKFTQDPLSTPNLASCSFWVYPKVLVPLSVVPIDRALRRFNGTIIAIVYDTPRPFR
jgi:hypothetical protein